MSKRIVVLGAVEFSREALLATLEAGAEVVGVVTLDPALARRHADYVDLAAVAKSIGIPGHYVGNMNDPDSLALVRSLDPDLLFVFGWSQLLSRELLEVPRIACIGTHPALLPRDRGRHPIIWALVDGLEESGLTFLYLDETADGGDILWQRAFPISIDDDARTVYDRVTELARAAIAEFVPQFEAGAAPRVPQDETAATYRRKRGPEDGVIHWEESGMRIYNLVRALTRPYGGAETLVGGQKMTVWRADPPVAEARAGTAHEPGTVIAAADWLDVRTGNGVLRVREYEAPVRPAVGARLGGES